MHRALRSYVFKIKDIFTINRTYIPEYSASCSSDIPTSTWVKVAVGSRSVIFESQGKDTAERFKSLHRIRTMYSQGPRSYTDF